MSAKRLTVEQAVVEVESYLDYEYQSGRLDERTKKALGMLLVVAKDYTDRERST